MLYEVAWCYRVMTEAEIDAARKAIAQAELEAVKKKLAKRLGPGRPLPALRPPHVPLAAVSLRLSERAAHEQYRKLIAGAPGAQLALQARLELAEMYAYRSMHKQAIKLLTEALEKKPAKDLGERIRVRLAASLLNTGKAESAERHITVVASNTTGPEAAHARYLAGEALAQRGEWKKVIDQLVPFRDHGHLQNLPGISDRALLRLGQAHLRRGQWDACRHTFTALAQRFRTSPWVDEALYGVGRSWHEQKQLDRAVEAYLQVTRLAASEWAARAQLQAGLCRLAQKRYPEALQALLAVPLTYDYPEWNAAARYEAGNTYVALKQPEHAVKLWKMLVKEDGESGWARKARQRLTETSN